MVYPFYLHFVCKGTKTIINLKLLEMKTQKEGTTEKVQHGIGTMAWANLCHNCGICAYANKKPDSNFNKAMIWHRTWCPGWLSHIKVYGKKQL